MAQSQPHDTNSNPISEFLYHDPDTGMIICMIADGDGFRPAHAAEEAICNAPEILTNLTTLPRPYAIDAEDGALTDFVKSYEHAYFSPGMS